MLKLYFELIITHNSVEYIVLVIDIVNIFKDLNILNLTKSEKTTYIWVKKGTIEAGCSNYI